MAGAENINAPIINTAVANYLNSMTDGLRIGGKLNAETIK